MQLRSRSVALLATNPAFSELLCKALEAQGRYRVAGFASAAALESFLRHSPVDVVVLDAEPSGLPATDIAAGLRANDRLASPRFEIVALARVTPFAQAPLARAGIDAVLQKPVAPGQLLDCLDQLTTGHTVPPRRHPIGTPASVGRKPAPRPAGNVIPFPRAGAR